MKTKSTDPNPRWWRVQRTQVTVAVPATRKKRSERNMSIKWIKRSQQNGMSKVLRSLSLSLSLSLNGKAAFRNIENSMFDVASHKEKWNSQGKVEKINKYFYDRFRRYHFQLGSGLIFPIRNGFPQEMEKDQCLNPDLNFVHIFLLVWDIKGRKKERHVSYPK